MKKISTYIVAIVVAMIALSSCAKVESAASYEAGKRYFDAWMHVHYPEAEANEDGIYIINETEGTGAEIDDSAYVMISYTARTLDGSISATSEESVAKQYGSYDKSYWYGERVWYKDESSLQAGVEFSFKGMKIGGSRTVIIPRWLMTTSRYNTMQEYLDASSSSDADYIYSFTVLNATDSVYRWENNKIKDYIAANYSDKEVRDDTYGFNYIQLKEPKDTNSFPSDTTFYINYIGRLLNGQVFDTTIADTAKMYNIYNSSKTYSPVLINWAEEASSVTMGSDASSLITGFTNTLWEMRHYEKGVGIFYSAMGYSTSGSGSSIPEYAPLIFEIEIVDKP